MNKRNIAKAFNEAPKGIWVDILPKAVQLSTKTFESSEESRQEINTLVDKFINTYLSKAVQKKTPGLKVQVRWPKEGGLENPQITRVEIFRYATGKYVMLIQVA